MIQCSKQFTKGVFTGQYNGSIEFTNNASFGLRRSASTPTMDDELTATHESSNRFDRYAIAAIKTLPGTIRPSVVGHLPREFFRFTYYVTVHGGRLSCKLTDAHHRRSPLVQGGLEIPVLVTVIMELGNNNVQVVKKDEELVNEHYKEPSNGNFDDVTASILKELMSNDESDLESESETEVEVAANVDVEDGADLEHTTKDQ